MLTRKQIFFISFVLYFSSFYCTVKELNTEDYFTSISKHKYSYPFIKRLFANAFRVQNTLFFLYMSYAKTNL